MKNLMFLSVLMLLGSCYSEKAILQDSEKVKYFVISYEDNPNTSEAFEVDQAVSEIEYLPHGCIKYTSLSYGKTASVSTCYYSRIVKKDSLNIVQFVKALNDGKIKGGYQ